MITAIASSDQQDSLVNQASGTGMVQRVTQAIKQASLRTGVDFSYLLNKASQESGFDPNAKASGSTATGLFQFTSQTWLHMVKKYGSEFGLGDYADKIAIDKNGTAHVSDTATRQSILSMRKDPALSAEMAGELDKQNLDTLKSDVGGIIGPTELYLAHFLGASGATDFINTMRQNPDAAGASVVPGAAASNSSVFYDKSGNARSLSQIYQQFARKFNRAPVIPSSLPDTAMVAANVSTTGKGRYSTSAMSSYNVADAAGVLSQTSAYSASNSAAMSGNASLVNTMLLAQMHMKGLSDTALLGSLSGEHRKTAIGVSAYSSMG